jgi:amylosucrase
MLHGIILAFGGIPLIYAGDEIATLNDYSFLKDKTKKGDNRWINRPYQDWNVIAGLEKEDSPQAKVFFALKNMIALRKKHPFFADENNIELHYTNNHHVLVFERKREKEDGLLAICNFNDTPEVIDGGLLEKLGYLKNQEFRDLITAKKTKLNSGFLEIDPYQLLWLKK